MSLRLPSLPALRAFEAAGRHLSFTKAAAELFVTQAAISHQVRALEEQLKVKLFQRTTRRLALTEAGRRLLPAATAAFEGLARAVADLGEGERLLTVTTTASFGARWLAPRLGRFAAEHPEVDLSVRHTAQTLDLRRDGVDLALRWGRGHWPGTVAEMLATADVTPVCAPSLLQGRRALKRPEDLARATLLHDDNRAEWREWMLVAGLDPAPAARGPVFDDHNVLLQAALDGQGVALAMRPLVRREVAAGRLVTPFALSIGDGYGYYLVYLPEALERAKVAAFRAFVLAEAKAETSDD